MFSKLEFVKFFRSQALLKSLFCLFAFWAGSSLIGPCWAHVHGLSELSLLKKETDVLVEWKVPAFDLLGFEQKILSKSQKNKWREVEEKLKEGEKLFTWPDTADCRQTSSDPLEKIERSESHYDLLKRWGFTCSKPQSLRWVDIRLTDKFSSIRDIRVQILSEEGTSLDQLGRNRQRAYFPSP